MTIKIALAGNTNSGKTTLIETWSLRELVIGGMRYNG